MTLKEILLGMKANKKYEHTGWSLK